MKYKEESYVLDTLKELQEKIRDMPIEQLIHETHENNIMLKQIIKVINTWFAHHNQENSDDFDRNVLANVFSEFLNMNKFINK